MSASYKSPALPVGEITSSLRSLDIAISEEDFQKPDPKRWMDIYSSIFNLFTSRNIADAMQRFCQYGEIHVKHHGLYEEAISQMGFTLCMDRVLSSCEYSGFCVQDVIEPTRKRLMRMMSAVVNRLKNDTERNKIYGQMIEQIEQSKGEHDKIVNVNKELKKQWAILMEKDEEQERQIFECTEENENLKSQIAECVRQKDPGKRIVEELKLTVSEKTALKEKLKTEKDAIQQEREKLLQKIVSSPDRFKQEQDRLTKKVMELKESIDTKLEKNTSNKAIMEQTAANKNAAEKAVRLVKEVLMDVEKANELLAEIDQCNEKAQILQEELTAAYTECDDMKENMAIRQGQKHTLSHQLDIKKQCLQQQKGDLQRIHEIYQEKIANIKTEMDGLKMEITELRQIEQSKSTEYERMEKEWNVELSEIYAELDILHNKIASACKEFKEIQRSSEIERQKH